MTARSTWKQHERDVAADLGGRRIPVTGVDRNGADVETPLFAVQVKVRRALPAWLWAWLSGICATARDGRVGVLVLRRPRERKQDGLVVLRYRDFVELHGPVERAGPEAP